MLAIAIVVLVCTVVAAELKAPAGIVIFLGIMTALVLIAGVVIVVECCNQKLRYFPDDSNCRQAYEEYQKNKNIATSRKFFLQNNKYRHDNLRRVFMQMEEEQSSSRSLTISETLSFSTEIGQTLVLHDITPGLCKVTYDIPSFCKGLGVPYLEIEIPYIDMELDEKCQSQLYVYKQKTSGNRIVYFNTGNYALVRSNNSTITVECFSKEIIRTSIDIDAQYLEFFYVLALNDQNFAVVYKSTDTAKQENTIQQRYFDCSKPLVIEAPITAVDYEKSFATESFDQGLLLAVETDISDIYIASYKTKEFQWSNTLPSCSKPLDITLKALNNDDFLVFFVSTTYDRIYVRKYTNQEPSIEKEFIGNLQKYKVDVNEDRVTVVKQWSDNINIYYNIQKYSFDLEQIDFSDTLLFPQSELMGIKMLSGSATLIMYKYEANNIVYQVLDNNKTVVHKVVVTDKLISDDFDIYNVEDISNLSYHSYNVDFLYASGESQYIGHLHLCWLQ